MEHAPLIFSLLFFTVGIIISAIGIYTVNLDPSSALNRVFFLISVAVFVWAFGFSVAVSAPNQEICLFWRRFSALGWGSVYALLLHFFLILTERTRILRTPWIYAALYVPAALVWFVFAFSAAFASRQYDLEKTPLGWTNVPVNNGWDMFFNLYYILFTIAGIFLLWQWGTQSKGNGAKQQSRLILVAFILALTIGTATDIVGNSILPYNIPQIAPIIILIPVSTMYYSIKRYKLLSPKATNENESILNSAHRVRVINMISIVFLAGGFLHFISQYLFNEQMNLFPVTAISSLLVLGGLFMQLIQRSRLKQNHQELLNIIIISSSIPLVTLRYVQYASITVWAFPFLFIIIALVFNKRLLLLVLSLTTLLTQVLVWILVPAALVPVNQADHIARLGMFGIGIWLAFYVNNLYLLRLKENSNQIRMQRLISEVSSDFIAVNETNFEEKTLRLLKSTGDFLNLDRTFVYLFDHETNTISGTYGWCLDTSKPCSGSYLNLSLDSLPWWMNQILGQRVVEIHDVTLLPADAEAEKNLFRKHQVLAFASAPIVSNDAVLGLIGFDSAQGAKKWRDDQINLLKILSNIFADALRKLATEKEINQLAYYDHLTKLPNRLLFQDRVKQAIYLSNRTEKMVGVIFLDLDSFKNVNDTMGHEGGDDLLCQVAKKLTDSVRKSDTVSRIGGDEFIIMVNQISEDGDMIRIADNMMGLFNKPFILKGQEFFITASAGISVYPRDGIDAGSLIKNADIAMYNAKDKGKNQYMLCSTNMKNDAHNKMRLINGLYRALDRNQLLLHYQPQVSLSTNQIVGVEALLRWDHPEFGMVSPNTFIPLAEQTGLINSIGDWTLKTACEQNKKWQDMGLPHVRMAVNLSVNQFRNPNLVKSISRVLEETGLDPSYLELEITENIAIRESNYIISVLNHLKEIGVSISIDDFGTEYSSLSRLTMLPVDRIKMDMQFVRGIEGTEKDVAITDNIINLAKTLGLYVIAEGVESKTQLEFLNQRKCDEVQGYYYYKPMTASEVEVILRSTEVVG